jgi:hypothetical protein
MCKREDDNDAAGGGQSVHLLEHAGPIHTRAQHLNAATEFHFHFPPFKESFLAFSSSN